MFVGYLFLAISVFFVGETAIHRVTILHQNFLHLGRIEIQGIDYVPEIGLLVPVAFLRFQPVGIDAVVVGEHLDTHGNVIRVLNQFLQDV